MPRQYRYEDDQPVRDRDMDRGGMDRDMHRGGMDRSMDDYRRSPRNYRSDRDKDRDRAFFRGSERDPESRDRNRPIGGWGGLMGEEGYRDRDDRGESWRRRRDESRGEDRRYGSDDHNRGVPMDETERLIASNKVEGTPVYDRHGDKLGSVHNFMVDKRSGQVVYAVLKHSGGFLGLNERYYPLDWDQLDYDTRLEGYAVGLEEEDLDSFGSFDSDGRWRRGLPPRESGRSGRRDRSSRDRW